VLGSGQAEIKRGLWHGESARERRTRGCVTAATGGWRKAETDRDRQSRHESCPAASAAPHRAARHG
jgi:hypothetical protein